MQGAGAAGPLFRRRSLQRAAASGISPRARCRFGKYLRVEVNGSVPPVAEVLRDFPSRRSQTEHGEIQEGLRVRLQLQRREAIGELDLGDAVRFYPSDGALERWQTGSHGPIAIVYE